MNDKTLVDRLRNLAEEWFEMCDDIHEPLNEAATRIEALEAENADLKRRLDNICMSIHTCSGDECERPICIANRKNKALEAEKAQMRRQGQDEGFAAAVQELRDMSARKPLPTLWHAASVLADSLEQSRIPCQALESQP